jgi:hypothetical protein
MKIKTDSGHVLEIDDNSTPEDIDEILGDFESKVGTGEVPKITNYNNILSNVAKGLQGFNNFSDQAMGNMVNTATFNLPQMIQQKTGVQLLPNQPQTGSERAGAMTGNVLGFLTPGGGPEMLGKGAVGLLPKGMQLSSKLIPSIAKGATELGAQRAGFIPANLAMGQSPESEAKKTVLTAGLGGVGSGVMSGLFGRQIAKESMAPSGAIKQSQKEMYDKLYSSGAKVDPTPLYKTVRDAAQEAQSFSGQLPSKIRGWLKKTGEYIDKGEEIPVQEVEKIRQEASALYKEGTHLKTPTVQNAIRQVGDHSSQILEDTAGKYGIKDWGSIQNVASESYKTIGKPSLLANLQSAAIPGALAGGATYAATGDAGLSGKVGMGVGALAFPPIRDIAYQGLKPINPLARAALLRYSSNPEYSRSNE